MSRYGHADAALLLWLVLQAVQLYCLGVRQQKRVATPTASMQQLASSSRLSDYVSCTTRGTTIGTTACLMPAAIDRHTCQALHICMLGATYLYCPSAPLATPGAWMPTPYPRLQMDSGSLKVSQWRTYGPRCWNTTSA